VAIESFPFDDQDTTEDQYSLLMREFQESGVVGTYGGDVLAVSVLSGLTVQIQSGFAIMRGHALRSTSTETKTMPASAAVALYHRVVLRLDPTANAITIEVKEGVGGGGVPALDNTAEVGVFEISLAIITVPANATELSPANVQDTREFVGGHTGAWSTVTRPLLPRIGRLGYNSTLGQWEFWSGTAWVAVVQPDTYSRLTALEKQPFSLRTTAWQAGVSSSYIPNSAWTTLDWRLSNPDSYGITYALGTGKFTIPSNGLYHYDVSLTFDTNSVGNRYLRADLVGGEMIDYHAADATTGAWSTVRIHGVVRLVAGNQFYTQAYQDSGAQLITIDGAGTQRISLTRIGN